ncbi:MAG: MG2 domain-containing protein [Bacteroidota bacterium]|nr:MG2 domain-containing protein [Bacteroidota bacterium]
MKLRGIFLVLFSVFTLISCSKKWEEETDPTLYKDYILSYTSGLVSSHSDIRLVFAQDISKISSSESISSDWFEISPKAKGELLLLSGNTLSFVPEKPLKQDTNYTIRLKISAFMDVPEALEYFTFRLKTFKQDFAVATNYLQSYDKDFMYLEGSIKSSDIIHKNDINQLVKAKQKDKNLKVKIVSPTEKGTNFNFIIDSISTSTKADEVLISWDGKPLDVDNKGTLTVDIPQNNVFKVLKIKQDDSENQTITINFSAPIRKNQNLNGLVQIDNSNNFQLSSEGNLLKIFLKESLYGTTKITVFEGIQSQFGQKLNQTYSQTLNFDPIKPNIRFVRNGSIMPESNNLKLNFEAANLSAVDVTVYKVHQNNILQFLQDNELNGSLNLRKVAAPVVSKKLDLLENKLANYSKWNAFAIDLSKIITVEKGAIYRVELSFKKSYSLYNCPNPNQDEPEQEQTNKAKFDEVRTNSSYDYDYYDSYWYDDYSWQDAQDPCTNSYYYRNPIASNILATNIGAVVKRGTNGDYFVGVSDIISTKAIADAKVELFDFQQQKLASAKTDSNGNAFLNTSRYAFFAIITKNNEYCYVRLDQGQSLSVSNFDVSGKNIQEGIRGFIYTERGVWRPGDTIYLNFMLNDSYNKLSDKHPIKLRLNDPSGKTMYESIQKYTQHNLYLFKIPTLANYTTGSWEAKIEVGGASFYKRIPLETIKPNRIKIKSTFSTEYLSNKHTTTNNIEAHWLHGAIAKDLKVEVKVKYTKDQASFKQHPNYSFDNPTVLFTPEEKEIFTGKTNSEGKVSYAINQDFNEYAPSMIKASFITKIHEKGGDFSTDISTIRYAPFEAYIGIKTPKLNTYGALETNKHNKFDLVSVDPSGKTLPNRNVKVTIYKVNWKWWWDNSWENLSNYSQSSYNDPFKEIDVRTDDNGKGSFNFMANNDQWGRYLILATDTQSGHTSGKLVYIDWGDWSGNNHNRDASFSTMLTVSLDKKEYQVGETATLSFPSSKGGRALISIENSSKILETIWVETQQGVTKTNIPITDKMSPNVFVNVTLLQPHASTINDSPIRLYGIASIGVYDKNTRLEPQLQMPDVVRPDENFTLKVSEKSGRAMTYTIAIVDEGLLGLTKFKTPNPWDEFYSKQALGVHTWDIYDQVIGAYGGTINQIFTIGGDEHIIRTDEQKANRFKPAIIYLGPFTLDAQQTAIHQVKIPNYIGSVRTMVIASNTQQQAYGSVDKTTMVRKPLMVLGSLPRKASPTEKITLPVTVFSLEQSIKNVTVQIKTNAALKSIGSNTQEISFKGPDEKMAYFDLEVNDTQTIGKVDILVKSGSHTANYSVELDIYNPNPLTYVTTDFVIEPNSSKKISYKGINAANAKSTLEASVFPNINLQQRLDYLITYPHGCLEQTTSGAFAQLFLDDFTELSSHQRKQVEHHIKHTIQHITQFQHTDGGFTYWLDSQNSDDWTTSYVGHFLIEAKKKGYLVSEKIMSKWISYQLQKAKEWRATDTKNTQDLAQAYRLYTLALASSPDMGSMNRLRELKSISNEGKIRLAGAYAIAGQEQAAKSLLNKSDINIQTENQYYFGSLTRSKAMVLEVLILLNDRRANSMAKEIAETLSSSKYLSTQSTAYALNVLSRYISNSEQKGFSFEVNQKGKSTKLSTPKAYLLEKITSSRGNNELTIKNQSDKTLFVRITSSGTLPMGEEIAVENKLSLDVKYFDLKGNVVDINSINQGTEFWAKIKIRNNSDYAIDNVALTHIIPSGLEIINTRYTDYTPENNMADNIDIRDDRSNFYFNLNAKQTLEFSVILNASYLGTYYLPGTQAEAMYDNTYLARTKGQWIKIVR